MVDTATSAALHAQLMSHVSSPHGARYSGKMKGKTTGGWYIPHFPLVPELGNVLGAITADPRLHGLLASIHGAGNYRLLARSEIYISRAAGWHADAPYDAIGLYNYELDMLRSECEGGDKALRRLCEQGKAFPTTEPFWRTSLSNETQHVTTVAIYLQDHRTPFSPAGDDGGLALKPGSHLQPLAHTKANWPATTDRARKLNYGAGDAVVFDSRLLHRGPAQRPGALPAWAATPHARVAASMTFGRKANPFSEVFDRAFAMRSELYAHNSSLCRAEWAWRDDVPLAAPCAYEAVRQDLRVRPVFGARRTVLIVGGSSGVGAALVAQYAAAARTHVHATARYLAAAPRLAGVQWHPLDVTNAEQLAQLARLLELSGVEVDLLILCAGVNRGPLEVQSLVNAEAPFHVLEGLLPAVLRSRERRVALMTSSLAFARFTSPEHLRKRPELRSHIFSEKAANVRFARSEPGWRRQGVTAVLLQPGYVASKVNERFRVGKEGQLTKEAQMVITPEASARGLRAVLDALEPRQAGTMLDWQGKVVPLS